MTSPKFHGVLTAVLTPFDANGQVIEAELRRFIGFQLEHRIHGLYPLGTIAEGLIMTPQQRKLVAEIVVEEARSRVPVMVHVGAPDTETTTDLAKHAERIGADAVSAITPFYYHPDPPALVQHFHHIADAVSIPLYIYNNPGRTGANLSPAVWAQLARHRNIRGIKDSSKDLVQLAEYRLLTNGQKEVIAGSDGLFLPSLVLGATGLVSAISNPFPRVLVELYEAYRRGDLATAQRLHDVVLRLRRVLTRGPYITPYKEALRLQGLEYGTVRSPLRAMTKEELAQLRTGLQELGVLKPAAVPSRD